MFWRRRPENEEAPPRLPGLPRAEAGPQPEKFSEPDAIPFCSHPSFSYLWSQNLKSMKKIRLILAAAAALTYGAASACTNFIVTRGASTDGSVMVTYAADSHALYGALYHTLGGKHN